MPVIASVTPRERKITVGKFPKSVQPPYLCETLLFITPTRKREAKKIPPRLVSCFMA